MSDIEALCADYLSRLDTALSDRSVRQRRQIVEQITEHLNEARGELSVQSEVAVRSILERLGRPEDIVAAAALSDTAGPSPRSPRVTRGRVALVLSLVVLLAAVGLTVGLFESNSSPRSRTNGRTTSTPTTVIGKAAETVTVPVVVGDSISQATVAIQSAGLTIRGVDGSSDGLVDSQAPSGGSRVEPGSEVTLHSQPTSPGP